MRKIGMKKDHEIAGCDHLTGNKMKHVRVTSLMKYCIKIGPVKHSVLDLSGTSGIPGIS